MPNTDFTWRVNLTPRFPVLSMGEYMALDDGPRETMRRNMKYERIAPTLMYSKMQKAVASYLCSKTRDVHILQRCRSELEADRGSASSARAAENATYALRSLEVFERNLNALPIGGIWASLPPIYKPHVIEKVKISIQPTAILTVSRPRGKDLIGLLLVDTAKGIEPKTPEAATKLTNGMIHASYLLHEHAINAVVTENNKASTDHCMVFHSHRPELVVCPSNYKKMLGNMKAACRDIAAAWESIDPPPSFDPKKAKYRK